MPPRTTPCASGRIEEPGRYLIIAHAGRDQWSQGDSETFGLLLDFTVFPVFAEQAYQQMENYATLEGGHIVTSKVQTHGHFVMRIPITCPDGKCDAALDEHMVILKGIFDRMSPSPHPERTLAISSTGQVPVTATA